MEPVEAKPTGIIDRVRDVRDIAAWVRFAALLVPWLVAAFLYMTGKNPTPPGPPPTVPAQVMPQTQPLILVVTTGGTVPQVVPAATSK